jgi:hypothetical protein
MSFIIYQNPEDITRIIIMTPTGEVSIPELITRHITTEYKVCTSIDLDPDFIDSWQLINNNLFINMEHAKNQWRNKLREERKELLTQLDIDFMKALEQNDSLKLSEIAIKKQKLRDAPADSRIDQATHINELKILTLTFLSN